MSREFSGTVGCQCRHKLIPLTDYRDRSSGNHRPGRIDNHPAEFTQRESNRLLLGSGDRIHKSRCSVGCDFDGNLADRKRPPVDGVNRTMQTVEGELGYFKQVLTARNHADVHGPDLRRVRIARCGNAVGACGQFGQLHSPGFVRIEKIRVIIAKTSPNVDLGARYRLSVEQHRHPRSRFQIRKRA